MTPAERRDDTALWDEVHDRLVRYAASLGVGFDNAEDIAQETIGRAIARNVPFVDREDLLRWCQRVAHNQAMDEHRRRRRVVPFGETERGESVKDVADDVVSKDLLERTLRALSGLADGQREAILSLARDDSPVTGDRKEQVRLAVARSRARVHLRAAVGYLGVAVGAILASLRRLGRLAPVTSVAAAAVIGASITTTSPATHPAHPRPGPYRTAPAAHDVDTREMRPAVATRHVARRVHPAVPAHVDTAAPVRRTPSRGVPVAHVEPAGTVVDAKHRPQQTEDHLVCIAGSLMTGSVCVG